MSARSIISHFARPLNVKEKHVLHETPPPPQEICEDSGLFQTSRTYKYIFYLESIFQRLGSSHSSVEWPSGYILIFHSHALYHYSHS